MSATQERDRVCRIAPTDIASALRIARDINDPWFRCQALAYVAWHTPDHKPFLDGIAESLVSASSISNPNRAVTVAAWPVAALARRRFSSTEAMERNERELGAVVSQLTKAIANEPNPASRADALLMLVNALSPFKPKLRGQVLGPLVKECRDPANRKRQRQLEAAAFVIAGDDRDAAHTLIGLLEGGRKQRTAERIENQPEVLGPRPFFELSGTSRI
jgi:hypothetical protein